MSEPLRLKNPRIGCYAIRGLFIRVFKPLRLGSACPRCDCDCRRRQLYWLRYAPPYRLVAAAIRQFPSAQPLNPTQKGIRAAPSHRCSRRSGQGYINGVAALAAASVCPAIVAPLMALMGGADTPGRTLRAPSHRRPSPPISCVRSAAPGRSPAGVGGPASPCPPPSGPLRPADAGCLPGFAGTRGTPPEPPTRARARPFTSVTSTRLTFYTIY